METAVRMYNANVFLFFFIEQKKEEEEEVSSSKEEKTSRINKTINSSLFTELKDFYFDDDDETINVNRFFSFDKCLTYF